MTNADRIRQMSDEELAAFIEGAGCSPSGVSDCLAGWREFGSCVNCWLDWLKKEVGADG